ncbi:MAG: chromosome partition protein MukB [Kofleriaceae bacterium]|nr:chromosome partition protein MukB [Kofleriaceae bacterium]
MARTRIASLVLVNWRGVFYERYLLDPNVTALEGSNGAGKTTVMIAAYVALLPDMSRLRFTNLGESGGASADRGIWGRLGESGRPSYTALELILGDGTRMVAGVRLIKKGEPSVEPTPFFIEDLPEETSLQRLFLLQSGQDEFVPDLSELRDLTKAAGAKLTVFKSVREYFAALFEKGISPLRLVGEEERNKFNEMLRTSMTGGISKTLTSELRTFVLKKESGLADTLTRMRANLDSCRRSRRDVVDARRLQREISGVYDAGTAYFTRLALAQREEAEEHRKTLSLQKDNLNKVVRGHFDLQSSVTEHQTRQEQVQSRLGAARAGLDQVKLAEERRKRSQLLADELSERDDELQELSESAETLKVTMDGCEEDRKAQLARRGAAQDAYDRAAGGLAKLQDGLDELHRRARDYRQVHQSLGQAREFLDRENLSEDECSDALSEALNECEALDGKRAKLERETQTIELRRLECRQALDALSFVESHFGDGEQEAAAAPHQRAREALAEVERRRTQLQGLSGMLQERGDLEAFSVRQTAIWEKARAAGLEVGKVGASDALAARLETAELSWAKADESARHHQNMCADREREHAVLMSANTLLELRVARFARANSAAQAIEEHLGHSPPSTSAELLALAKGLSQQHAQLVAGRAALAQEREEFLHQAFELDSGASKISSELLRVRDELSGELVAGRFEELPANEAARLEAQLGPLAQAIIVDDLESSAAILRSLETPIEETIWLVASGTPLEALSEENRNESLCVVVQENVGLRVSPVPSLPTLGRSARQKAAALAREQALECGEKLEQRLRELHRIDALRRDAGVLLETLDVYRAGDPSSAEKEHRERGSTLLSDIDEHRERAEKARERAEGIREEVDSLRGLLGESFFLDPPDYKSQAVKLDKEIAKVREDEEQLLLVEDSRKTLSQLMDALRDEVPSEARAAAAMAEIEECETHRDRLWQASKSLEEVLRNRHALHWKDATEILEKNTNLVPALEEQHQSARMAMTEASEAVASAELAWTAATKSWQAADARMVASQMMRDRLALELSELGGPEPSDAGEEYTSVAAAERRLVALDTELLQVVEEGARDRERLRRSESHLEAARACVESEILACEPAQQAWQIQRERCEAEGLLASVLAAGESNVGRPRTSVQLLAEAQGKRDLLLDRLGQAESGEELRKIITELPGEGASKSGHSSPSDKWSPADNISAWLSLREWMRKRVPAQVVQEDDPLLALEALQEHLAVLETRLGYQESDLRASSEDVARGIDVQLRRARWQVTRLNEHLESISFGSIRGIRVQMHRVERMEQILRALREGEAQELLFQASLPFEDALNEIFSRYGGGAHGGQKLLDYREYLGLGVEIRRQSSDKWEEASPTKLSTGEAIGVGAALMMVVLTEWERDANLLRSRKGGGSLRFLFLDEANRLSKDNLAVLFDLCHHLELQLLIAAPEVAHAGNNTTYRLVRKVLPSGGEEVLVSGRRTIASADPPEDTPTDELSGKEG